MQDTSLAVLPSIGCITISHPSLKAKLVSEEKCPRPLEAFPKIADHNIF